MCNIWQMKMTGNMPQHRQMPPCIPHMLPKALNFLICIFYWYKIKLIINNWFTLLSVISQLEMKGTLKQSWFQAMVLVCSMSFFWKLQKCIVGNPWPVSHMECKTAHGFQMMAKMMNENLYKNISSTFNK